jgi:electron transport complex protein RnfE
MHTMADPEPTPAERFIRGILPENPVYRQLLGLCPTLAVTGSMASAITMSACVLFVLTCSNVMTSLIRGLVKPHLRILVFTVIIATFVTVVDRMLAAFYYPMSQALGAYVPLIICNCIVLCRCEVCASKQGVRAAAADAAGQSIGFALAVSSLATVREVLGLGTWFGWRVMPAVVPPWAVMLLPPGSFLALGLLIGAVNGLSAFRRRRLTAGRTGLRLRGAKPGLAPEGGSAA